MCWLSMSAARCQDSRNRPRGHGGRIEVQHDITEARIDCGEKVEREYVSTPPGVGKAGCT